MTSGASRQERIDAEAAGWLAAIECGTADARTFEQWRSGDPAHALAFLRVTQVSGELAALRETGLAAEAQDEPRAVDRRKLFRFGLGGVLAAGALAAGLGGLGAFSAAAQEAETAVGEHRRIVLASGLALELNTRSRVKWAKSGGGYEVELLQGEVLLERQPGSAPCRLRCGQSQIDLAAGGRMVARSRREGIDLSVLDGEAVLRTPASAVRVPGLRKAVVISGEVPAVSAISQRDAIAVSAWQQGQLQFNGESLENAVSEYNRYLTRPIEIADPSIRQLRLGGRFPATDPADFCRALSEIYGVSARVEGDRIRLMRG